MKSLRLAMSVFVLAALGAGYLGSQFYAVNRRAPEWTLLVDTPAVVWIALLVLIGSIALSLVKEQP
jgi:hypothetical protein